MLFVTVVVTALVTAFVTFGVRDLASMLPMAIKFVPDWVKISKLVDSILAILLVKPLLRYEFGQLDRYSMMDSKNSDYNSKVIFYIDDIRDQYARWRQKFVKRQCLKSGQSPLLTRKLCVSLKCEKTRKQPNLTYKLIWWLRRSETHLSYVLRGVL